MTRKLTTGIPAGGDTGAVIFPPLYDNAIMCKVVDDVATLAAGMAIQRVVKWNQTNNRWELCNGTVALSTTDVVGIVEYIDPLDATKGQVRIAGVYTDQTGSLVANTAYFCQANGTLGTTVTKVFVGRCTASGRLVMPAAQAFDTSIFALLGGSNTQTFKAAVAAALDDVLTLGMFAANIGANGRIKIPVWDETTGTKKIYKVQWMYISSLSNGNTAISWPYAYNVACHGITATTIASSSSYYEITPSSPSTTGCTLRNPNATVSSFIFSWGE